MCGALSAACSRELLRAKVVRRLQRSVAPNSIRWEFCNIVEADPQRRLRLNISHDKLETLHPADLADIVEELSPEDREAIIGTIDSEVAAEALSEIDPKMQASILEALEPEVAADIVDEMSPDEAADALGEMHAPCARHSVSCCARTTASTSTRRPRRRRSTQLPGGPASPYASRRRDPARSGPRRRASEPRRRARRRRRGDGRRLVAAPQGMPFRRLPLGVRRPRPQPLAPMVLDARLREPREGPRLPGHGMRKGLRIVAPLAAGGARARRVVRRARACLALSARCRSNRDVGDDVRRLGTGRCDLRARRRRWSRGRGRRRAAPERALRADRHHRRAVVPRAGLAAPRRGAARRRRVVGARRRRHAAIRPSRDARRRRRAVGRLGRAALRSARCSAAS